MSIQEFDARVAEIEKDMEEYFDQTSGAKWQQPTQGVGRAKEVAPRPQSSAPPHWQDAAEK